MTARAKPPFRADMVGSLLRTQPLKEAREKFQKREIDAAALQAVEDTEIRKIVSRQESIGLKAVTDGEFRRSWWHFDFLWGLDGVTRTDGLKSIQFKGLQTRSESVAVTGKVSWPDHHPMIDHFKFVKAATKATPKMTIPSPSVLHFRGGRPSIDQATYPTLEPFFEDLGEAYAGAVRGFAEAGCTYLQLDDTVFSYLCDPEQCAQARTRGDDPDRLPDIYAGIIPKATAARPAGMAVTMHSCRGNFKSSWISQGGYEPVADVLFNKCDIDGYFLEWDTDRAGGFEPLRFLPKGKTVVLGLVTSKSGTLEARDDVKRRIEEAARYAPIEQLCLSPQCGFASTEEGNVLAEDEQWRKLEMIVRLAEEVWG